MSSFVIGKLEYIKAAGAVAGIAEFYKNSVDNIFVYDYQHNHKMETEDFYNCFVEFFNMNALSVYEQYSPRHEDETLYSDSEEYKNDFIKYMRIGKNACFYPEKLNKIIFDLRDFLQSAMYQTENEAYFHKIKMISNSIIVELMKLLEPAHNCTCWGDFNIE